MTKKGFALIIFISCCVVVSAQPPKGIHWNKEGNAYYSSKTGEIVQYDLPSLSTKVMVSKTQLTPQGSTSPLKIRNYFFSNDGKKLLIYTNSKKVW